MKIALLGDIALFGKYAFSIGEVPESRLERMASLLHGYDFVIGNLETPLTSRTRKFGSKSAYIKGNPSDVRLLKMLNIGIVGLANNHMFDYGPQGQEDTLETLDRAGIKWFGVDGTKQDFCVDRLKIELLGYCCASTNPLGLGPRTVGGHYVNGLDPIGLEDRIRSNHSTGTWTIVSVHAGAEHVNYPSTDHIRLARKLSAAGNYTYYGHHPHVVQGIEQFESSLLAYSLGNFCFDDVYTEKSIEPLIRQTENNRRGLVLQLEFNNTLSPQWKAIPIFDNGREIVWGEEADGLSLDAFSSAFGNGEAEYRTMRERLLAQHRDSRKTMRDLKWYLSRINLRSLGIILNARKNSRRYAETVGRYLGKNSEH